MCSEVIWVRAALINEKRPVFVILADAGIQEKQKFIDCRM